MNRTERGGNWIEPGGRAHKAASALTIRNGVEGYAGGE
jgi:hypothetical protein